MQKNKRTVSTQKLLTFLCAFAKLQRLETANPTPQRRATPLYTLKLRSALGRIGPLLERSIERGNLINVWSLSGIREDEVRNSAVLAWLFDMRGSHGLKASVLHALLDILKARNEKSFPLPLSILSTDYVVSTETYQLADKENRIDITVDSPSFTLFVEIKIGAPEGKLQLQRYLDLAQRKAAKAGHSHYAIIYLTTDHGTPSSIEASHVIRADWRDISEAIGRALATRKNVEHQFVYRILNQFRNHISQF